jgi:hypothetical protein
MLKLLIDENLDQRILRGLLLHVPGLLYTIVQETGLARARDARCFNGQRRTSKRL